MKSDFLRIYRIQPANPICAVSTFLKSFMYVCHGKATSDIKVVSHSNHTHIVSPYKEPRGSRRFKILIQSQSLLPLILSTLRAET